MSEFKITVCSDPDHEDLIAEIYFDDEFVGLVSQEQGYESLDLELHPLKSGEPHRFKLKEFEAAVEKAKARLWELRRVSSPDVPS